MQTKVWRDRQKKILRSRQRYGEVDGEIYEEIVTIENKKRQTFIPMDTESASILLYAASYTCMHTLAV